MCYCDTITVVALILRVLRTMLRSVQMVTVVHYQSSVTGLCIRVAHRVGVSVLISTLTILVTIMSAESAVAISEKVLKLILFYG